MAWNEPLAASFLGENVPKEHLMYVLEIDPPVDKNDDNSGVTLMPACNVSTVTDKTTDVWSRPLCIYRGIISPKKNWFFHFLGVKKKFLNFFSHFW